MLSEAATSAVRIVQKIIELRVFVKAGTEYQEMWEAVVFR